MKTRLLAAIAVGVALAARALGKRAPAQDEDVPRIDSRYADVSGTRIHYLIAGEGEPVILLHGYAHNSHMWRPLMAELMKTRTVIAPDLRGFGQSAKPDGSYDKKTLAQDIHALVSSLRLGRVKIAGFFITGVERSFGFLFGAFLRAHRAFQREDPEIFTV